jgi:hypothetical protein
LWPFWSGQHSPQSIANADRTDRLKPTACASPQENPQPRSAEGGRYTLCNLYSITTNQAAIIALFRVINRYEGNLAPMRGVFLDHPAPVKLRRCRDRWPTMRSRLSLAVQTKKFV